MNKETDDIIKAVTTAGIIGTLAATIRALLSKEESRAQRLRTFFAGVLMSVLLGLILRNTTMGEFMKEVIIGASGAFVSSIWPILERSVKNYVKKKGDDVVRNGDN